MTPANFGEFVMTGAYRKVLLPEEANSFDEDRALVITGCGMSGTTLFFCIVTSTSKLSTKLDEPRELYMSLLGEWFDIWSVKSKQRSGQLCPTEAVNTTFTPVYRALSPDLPISYIEKTPEHILRLKHLLNLHASTKFVYMRRDWISVALSIWEITDKSKKPIRWYGAKDCKWLALAKDTVFEKVSDVFVRATLEWIFSEQAYLEAVKDGVDILKVDYETLIDNPSLVSSQVQEFTNGDFVLDQDLAAKTILKKESNFEKLKLFLVGEEPDFGEHLVLKDHLAKVKAQVPIDLIKQFLV